MKNILIVDDEPSILLTLEMALEDDFEVYTASNVTEANIVLESVEVNVVLLDQRLGTVDGLKVLLDIRARYPNTLVIAMTAYGSIKSSVEAMQAGAYYYITKPLDINGLKILINKAIDYQRLSYNVDELNNQLQSVYNTKKIVTASRSMDKVLKTIERIKDLDINVLITGETGTGKEMVANMIHYSSNRSHKPLKVVNCAAIPHNLLESELFGYEKGAFTGADSRYRGKFEQAHEGTLFFDELGELDMGLQAKVLRAIQEKSISPLGSEKQIQINTRFIAATNVDLEKAIENGTFREDLYYRMNVVIIEIPPLRKRKEDICVLASYFLNKYAEVFNRNITGFSYGAIKILESYAYPGNVRELENIIERAVALADEGVIEPKDLPKKLLKDNIIDDGTGELIPVYVGEKMKDVEKKIIMQTLKSSSNNKRKTATILGISERSLHNKLKEYREAGDDIEL